METEVTKKLTLFNGVIIGLNGALGIEFFTLLEHATLLAGPAVVLSLFLCGLLNILTMFSYCELGTSISRVGAEYTFTKAAFGGFISFLTGWLRWVVCIFIISLSAIGFAQMVQYFFPVNTQLIALLIIVLFTLIDIRGARKFEIDLAIVLIFVSIFLIFDFASLLHGTKVESPQSFMPNGLPGVMAGVMYTFSMFFGVRSIVVQSLEMKSPETDVPKAILYSSIILIAIYCSVASFAIGFMPLQTELPGPLLTYAAEKVMGSIGGALISIAGISAALMSLTTAMMIQTSVISAMSRDGYMPRIVLLSHSRFGTRYVATVFGSLAAILFAASGLVVFVGYVVNFASLLIFAIVNMSLIRLRRKLPRLSRPFKAPLYPYTPVLGVVVALTLLIFVENPAIVLGFLFILITIVVYNLRMVGYHRLRLAIGGINFGISGLIALLVYLSKAQIMRLPFLLENEIILYVFTIVGIVFFAAGIFNITEK